MELVGYAFRAASHSMPYTIAFFVVQVSRVIVYVSQSRRLTMPFIVFHDRMRECLLLQGRFRGTEGFSFPAQAPIFFSAALYLSLSRTSRLYSADHILPAPPKWIVACESGPLKAMTPNDGHSTMFTVFVTDDIVTTALQVTGASLIGTAESSIGRGESPSVSPDTANHILTAGLAIQVCVTSRDVKLCYRFLLITGTQCATFLGFLCIVGYSAINNRKMSHAGIKSETASFERSSPAKVPTLFFAILTITSLLVWLRTLFRLAETAQGLFSFASTSEALFGTLEFAPIILTLLLWAAWPLHKM